MFFTKESALAKLWVKNVKEGKYRREQVPDLFNLRDVVYQLLDEENAA